MKIFLTIIGWISVIWLIDSFINSIRIHFKVKDNLQTSDKDTKKFLENQIYSKATIPFEITKLVIVLVLLYFLL